MKNAALALTAGLLLSLSFTVTAATFYVDVNNRAPASPYSSWTTAATNIQDAVDVAAAGDLILVTNGVYATGGRDVYGTTNRVAVTKPLTVQSVNGPGVTSIDGLGTSRCVVLADGSVLAGFTLTNGGSADSGGGVYCASETAIVTNSVLAGNSAPFGGGACGGTLNNCTLTGNSASYSGGGAYYGMLNNCTLTGNSASDSGGGAYYGTLNNCTLTGNSASNSGGGAYHGTLNNCIVYYNTAPDGNFSDSSTLNYCCTTPLPFGGTNNFSAQPQLASASHLSANSPCRGAGNPAYASGLDIDGEPWADPPAIGCDDYWSGSVTGTLSAAIALSYTNLVVGSRMDFQAVVGGRVTASAWEFGDGTVVSNRPYASHAWSATGDYSVVLWAYNETYPSGVAATVTIRVVTQPVHYVSLASGSPISPYGSWETAATNIQDAVDAVTVPGALVLVSNGVYQTGSQAAYEMGNQVAVTKPVTVQSVNGPNVTSIDGLGTLRCVYLPNGAVLAGFTLTNGAADYYGGGVCCESETAVVTNCVLTGNSASGDGGGAYSGTLNNCTLTSNWASSSGGGAFGGTLNNCVLTNNLARQLGGAASHCTLNNCTLTGNRVVRGSLGCRGGGAYSSTLNNCTLSGNQASGGSYTTAYGGGAYGCTLNNCTLSGNSATSPRGAAYAYGGGASGGTLNNCIVYYNTPSDVSGSSLNYCCTPYTSSGVGNITAEPLFMDYAGGNLRLQPNSPCIDAGYNAYAVGGTDLDGNPRIARLRVDMGAYEYQGAGLSPFIAWLQQYALQTDGSDDFTDPDGDGMNNWQEWLAGTNPTNAASVLLLQLPVTAPGNVTLTWTSVTNRAYVVERATNLADLPAFTPLQAAILGLLDTTSFTDTNPPPTGPAFYRVGVQP